MRRRFCHIAEPDDAVFVISSFSKPWAMTGWRIGWLVHPDSLATADGGDGPGQQHRRHAFRCNMARWRRCRRKGDAFRGELLARCAAGRDVVEDFLAGQNRIRWMKPEGAFYGFLHVDGLKDSLALRAGDGAERQGGRGARRGLLAGRSARRMPICASVLPRMPASWPKGWSGSRQAVAKI